MNRVAVLISATASMVLSSSAQADIWLDDKSRSLTLQAPGVEVTNITANGHNADDAATLFKQACFSTKLDRALIGMALADSGWGFKFVDKIMPFKEPVNIGGFYAPDAFVNASNSMFFNKTPQCNLVVQTVDRFQRSVAEAALTKALGSEPSNIAEATKKGKPNKSYHPKWVVSNSDGMAFTVTVRASVIDPAATHFTALQEVKKK